METDVALHAVQKEFDYEKLALEEEEMKDKEAEMKLNKELEFALERENTLKSEVS